MRWFKSFTWSNTQLLLHNPLLWKLHSLCPFHDRQEGASAVVSTLKLLQTQINITEVYKMPQNDQNLNMRCTQCITWSIHMSTDLGASCISNDGWVVLYISIYSVTFLFHIKPGSRVNISIFDQHCEIILITQHQALQQLWNIVRLFHRIKHMEHLMYGRTAATTVLWLTCPILGNHVGEHV